MSKFMHDQDMASCAKTGANKQCWWNGLGGTVHGSFFRAADSVDLQKPPGATPISQQGGRKSKPRPSEYIWSILNGSSFFYSPNLTWFGIAGLMWLIVPYQLHSDSSASVIDWKDDIVNRLVINHVIVLGYVGFWHITLDGLGWGKRSYVPNRPYNWPKVVHNVFYTTLGIIQWTFTEAAFLHCYRSGKLPYSASLESPADVMRLIIWVLAVPVIRDVHFYLAHRLIHFQFLFRFIHSLHHRNTDIEPFAGLCMHPCEHLYYYTCYAPLLFLRHHPAILLWMGIHVVLSPAASHSGYEDHFSADLYHYLHHRYYDCNYAGGIPFDRWFGTFRDRLLVQEDGQQQRPPPKDPKATLWRWPDHVLYQVLGVALPILLLVYGEHVPFPMHFLALLVTLLPIIAAAALYRGSKPFSPFEHDSLASHVFHVGGGVVLGVLPASYLVALTLS